MTPILLFSYGDMAVEERSHGYEQAGASIRKFFKTPRT